jgi:hypothetical protein
MKDSAQTVESVAWLQARLRLSARRYLRVETTAFCVVAVSLAVLGFGVYFLADFLVRFPRLVRILLTVGLTVAGGVWAVRVIRRWIVPHRTLDATARAVELAEERSGKMSHSTVVSALEFGERPDIPGAVSFKNLVIQAAHTKAPDPARVALHAASHVRLARRAGLAALVVAIGLAAVWPRAGIFARRLCGFSAAYPTATRLMPAHWPRVAPARVDYPVVVTVSGRIPASGMLTVRPAEGRAFTVPMTIQSNGTFAAAIQAPEASFSFSCELGDAETEPFKVTVHKAPLVRKVTATVTPPAYTGLPRRHESDDTVTVPEGSTVLFKVEPDSPVEVCAIEGGNRRIVCKPDEQGGWQGGGVFTDSWNYVVALTNAAGIGSGAASPRGIAVVRDAEPLVELRSPKPNSAVASIGSLVFEFVARDDYGLTNAGVSYEVYEHRDNLHGAIEEMLVTTKSLPSGPAVSGREAGVRFTKQVAELGLAPGQRLVVRGYAVDNRPTPGGQRGESDPASVTVVTPEELRSMLETELQQVGGLLQKLSDDEQRHSDVLRQRLSPEKKEQP